MSARLCALVLLGTAAFAGEPELLGLFGPNHPQERQAALTLARRALDETCLHRRLLPTPEGLPAALKQRGGVFVSAMLGDAPRCCMGSLYPTQPTLAAEIIVAAGAAAARDLRFPPIKPEELPRLRVIVSLLAPPEAIADPQTLDPVTEGLAVRSVRRTGVVLPGETAHRDLMIRWARIRAAARPEERLEFFRLRAARIIEPPVEHSQSRPAAGKGGS
jgi:AMMECR1 domain-containing protein